MLEFCGIICGCVVTEIDWQDERLGVSVCKVGVLWDYLRMCGCENWLAGLAFRSKRVQGWSFVGLFANV